MNPLIKEIWYNPLLCLLAFVSVVFATAELKPESPTPLFVLAVVAIIRLAPLPSHAAESIVTNSRHQAFRDRHKII